MNNVKDNETDLLYRNNEGKFTDVTNEAGIRNFGLSLSATVGGINNDYLDVFQVDMDSQYKKANMASMNPELF
jgi:hypothetical protein